MGLIRHTEEIVLFKGADNKVQVGYDHIHAGLVPRCRFGPSAGKYTETEAIYTSTAIHCRDVGGKEFKDMTASLYISIDQLNWGKVADIKYVDASLSEVHPLVYESNALIVATLAYPLPDYAVSIAFACLFINEEQNTSGSVEAVIVDRGTVHCTAPLSMSGSLSLFLLIGASDSTVFLANLSAQVAPVVAYTQPSMLV